MHFKNINEINQIVQAVIIKEMYFVKDSEINLLINNDILNFKLIDISISSNSTYIENCKITILIFVKTRFKFRKISIYTFKATIVCFKIECFVEIYNIILFDQNYLFESNTTNFSIYAHVINSNKKFILMCNERNRAIKISRNFRLNLLIDMNYFNAYVIDFALSDFVIKLSKKTQNFIMLFLTTTLS